MSRTRLLLGPVLLALLVGVGFYAAFCVNVKPTIGPPPRPTLVVLIPPTPTVSASPDVFTVPTDTPTPREAILATPGPKPTRTPMPTWTPTPEPTPRPEKSPVQRG